MTGFFSNEQTVIKLLTEELSFFKTKKTGKETITKMFYKNTV